MLIIVVLLPVILSSFKIPGTRKYVVDKKESVVTWKGFMQFVPKNAHNGYIDISKGELMIEEGQLVGGTFEVDMNTISDERHQSDNDLVDHLKSVDFFDAEKFPVSTFTITRVATEKKKNTEVTGDLTIKGITREVTFPAAIEVNAGIVNASARMIIDRSKWDVRYGSGTFFSNFADETISDEIEFNIKIVAKNK
jgi:polyisoprenoid-binding protein YceI